MNALMKSTSIRPPIRLHPSIPIEEIVEALQAKGLLLRDDGVGRLFVDRVPRFLLDRKT